METGLTKVYQGKNPIHKYFFILSYLRVINVGDHFLNMYKNRKALKHFQSEFI